MTDHDLGGPVKQLTGIDANFLYMETDAVFGHVSSLSIFERPAADYDPYEAWKGQIAERLHLLEPLTRRVMSVPFNLDHPFWIQDPDFDLDFHVRHTAVPEPGTDRQLAALVARIVGRPLDRARPLWESYVIEGLPDDRFAVLTKVHHATVDGASGSELLGIMLDSRPEGDELPPPPAERSAPERLPTEGELLAAATQSLARKPGRMLVLASRTARGLGETTNNPLLAAAGRQLREQLRGPLGRALNLGRARPDERDEVSDIRPLPGAAPRTPFNASVTPHRSFAFRSVPLQAVKDVKNAVGATVNDVVMSVCAGGLRAYLDRKGALPDDPLVAMVPVSIRTGEEAERWSNRVSTIFAELPTDEADAGARIQKVHESMMQAKTLHDALPADELTQFADFPPPAVFTRASRLATRFQTANRVAPATNLVISNVPGPREPLYSAGAKLLHFIPISIVAEGQGLNITVQSYLDTLDFGLVGCAELVPDIDELLDDIVSEFVSLADAVGVQVDTGTPKASKKRAPAKKKATKKRAPAKKATKKKASKKRAPAKKAGTKKRATKKKTAKKTN